MVVGKTIDSLKERPHEEKKAVASGIAITVVIVLLFGWGFLFLRKIQQGAVPASLQGGAVPSDQFDLNLIRDTERQLSEMYQNTTQDLQNARDAAAQNQIRDEDTNFYTGQGVGTQQHDQFGSPGGGF